MIINLCKKVQNKLALILKQLILKLLFQHKYDIYIKFNYIDLNIIFILTIQETVSSNLSEIIKIFMF